MPSQRNQDLERLSAESQKLIAAARSSCDTSAEQIASSRKAIARSLQLLQPDIPAAPAGD